MATSRGATRRGCARPVSDGRTPSWDRQSAQRRCVEEPAVGPQAVLSALELERARRAEVALEDLAVVAAGLDGAQVPVVGQPERARHGLVLRDEPLHGGIRGVRDGAANAGGREAPVLGDALISPAVAHVDVDRGRSALQRAAVVHFVAELLEAAEDATRP